MSAHPVMLTRKHPPIKVVRDGDWYAGEMETAAGSIMSQGHTRAECRRMVLSAWVDVCAVDVADDGVLEHLDLLGKPQTFRSLLDGLSPYSSSLPARREQHGIVISVDWTPRELRDTLRRMRRTRLVRLIGRRYGLTAAGKRAAKLQWGQASKDATCETCGGTGRVPKRARAATKRGRK